MNDLQILLLAAALALVAVIGALRAGWSDRQRRQQEDEQREENDDVW